MPQTSLDTPGATALLIIYADPVGYYSSTRRGQWIDPRAKKYHAWSKLVRDLSEARGLRLPLQAAEDVEVEVETQAYFRNRTHPDPENVHKGIVDALFYGGKGDKYTGGKYGWPRYDADQPRVEVIIRRRK